jgi:tetratricopeptide (TPR) repeat protein
VWLPRHSTGLFNDDILVAIQRGINGICVAGRSEGKSATGSVTRLEQACCQGATLCEATLRLGETMWAVLPVPTPTFSASRMDVRMALVALRQADKHSADPFGSPSLTSHDLFESTVLKSWERADSQRQLGNSLFRLKRFLESSQAYKKALQSLSIITTVFAGIETNDERKSTAARYWSIVRRDDSLHSDGGNDCRKFLVELMKQVLSCFGNYAQCVLSEAADGSEPSISTMNKCRSYCERALAMVSAGEGSLGTLFWDEAAQSVHSEESLATLIRKIRFRLGKVLTLLKEFTAAKAAFGEVTRTPHDSDEQWASVAADVEREIRTVGELQKAHDRAVFISMKGKI